MAAASLKSIQDEKGKYLNTAGKFGADSGNTATFSDRGARERRAELNKAGGAGKLSIVDAPEKAKAAAEKAAAKAQKEKEKAKSAKAPKAAPGQAKAPKKAKKAAAASA